MSRCFGRIGYPLGLFRAFGGQIHADINLDQNAARVPGVNNALAQGNAVRVAVEPVKLSNFFLLFFSAAAVIILGAAYAFLFAVARIRNLPKLMPFAYAAYGGLCASVFALAYAANLYSGGIWVALIVVMLIGYLLAPHAAFRLCKGMHAQTLRPYEKG